MSTWFPVAAPGTEGPLSGRYLGNAVTNAKALLSETSSAQLLGNTEHVHVDMEFGPSPDMCLPQLHPFTFICWNYSVSPCPCHTG
jgi:hypothetical protein